MLMPLKAISAILSYPTPDLQAASDELIAALGQGNLLPADAVAAFEPLLKEIAQGDIYEVQETYVALFDRSRTLSLNLFEHVHGESRDRGPAMVDLLETYRAGGFELESSELPDHLPILLEFASTRPVAEAKELLNDAGTIMAALAERLLRRESSYAAILAGLVEFAGIEITSPEVQELLSVKDDDPEDLKALDDIWEEAEVTFGPDPNAGCPISRDMLANMEITPAEAQVAQLSE